MPSFLVRAAVPADIPSITRIYAHAVVNGTASFEIDPPDETEMARRQASLRDGGYPYLVADRDGAVLGYAYAGLYRARPAYRSTVENSVYVDPMAQRQGVGLGLLNRLVEDAAARGFRQMIAVIGDSAQHPSIALHRAAGFHLVGVLEAVGYKRGQWLDTVLMQRPLGRGAKAPPQ